MRKGAGCRPLRRDAPPYGNVSCHPRVDVKGVEVRRAGLRCGAPVGARWVLLPSVDAFTLF